jgi:AcrR family transcriptional regulator
MPGHYQLAALRDAVVGGAGSGPVDTGPGQPNLALSRCDEARTSVRSLALDEIYDAATEAVAVHGLDNLSVDDIAERAGCSRATVYRRVGGKDAVRDAVLDQAITRITAAVSQAVTELHGEERIITAVVASLDTIRGDPVSAALLTGPAAAQNVTTALITEVTGAAAYMAGLKPGQTTAAQWIVRVTLSLLCWPACDRDTEVAIIRQYVAPALAR